MIRHERREFVLDPEKLVYGIVVPLIFLALDFAVDVPLEDPGREPLRRRLPVERVGPQVRQVLLPPIEITLLMRGRNIAQFSVVASNPNCSTSPSDESSSGSSKRTCAKTFS